MNTKKVSKNIFIPFLIYQPLYDGSMDRRIDHIDQRCLTTGLS